MISHSVNDSLSDDTLSELFDELLILKQRILSATENEMKHFSLEQTSESSWLSIFNVLNYVVMRREALHPLQSRLAQAGLSSLGRIEPHVIANINSVLDVLSKAAFGKPYLDDNRRLFVDYHGGYRQLKQRAERLFGPPPEKRVEYIMVTMPTEAADDYDLVESLILAGMDDARINCAHDDPQVWEQMIANIKRAMQLHQKDCRILMDLAGHKIRTGKVFAGKHKSEKPHKEHHKEKEQKKFPRLNYADWLILYKDGENLSDVLTQFEEQVDVAVTCTYPDVIDLVEVGQSVWIDDGKIGTVIKEKNDRALLLQVNRVGPKGARLKEEKGLNFPQTVLNLPTLSDKDRQDLEFVSRHADMVGLSFTENAQDVLNLREELARLGREDLPILAKIETADAVRRLPEILVQSLAHDIDFGIMIARGDLAVELGSVRMAEIQDEILRLCEAAHVPVIWATQVLESLAKEGTISRPEISDAAMAQRAECVMLNKGAYVATAVTILSDVLQRMEAHQCKSHTHMRALHW
ncbi:pyruvate kinase [Thiomicrorhabdus sp.]|uniref:pyruvate kinase n=1 Tax=Thiomicrorhabdus sp. TaxID=2039724 RepID=UPI00356A23EB